MLLIDDYSHIIYFQRCSSSYASSSQAHQAAQVLHTLYIFSGVHQATQVLRKLIVLRKCLMIDNVWLLITYKKGENVWWIGLLFVILRRD